MLEQETVPAVAANARVEAYRAAFNASLTSLDRVVSPPPPFNRRRATPRAELINGLWSWGW